MSHSDGSSTAYDALPYHDRAFVHAHPDRLAVVGRLHGVAAAPVSACTVLELGCGQGGHLLPMAAVLPHSRFVGIDLSARQIERGRSVAERLGLENVELRRQDLMDFDGEEGAFDYIVCHGVYSWVPPEVQSRILALCRRCLAPDGLAMISYNTLPAWGSQGSVRELLRYGARGGQTPGEQVERALDFLSLVARNVFDPESPYGRTLRDAAEQLPREDPTYVFHEYLGEFNLPVRFDDFADRCSEAGLRFVGDADLHDPSGRLSDESRAALTAVADDVVRCEQTLDFLRNRRFRRDVLCRGDVATDRWPRPEALEGLLVVGQAEPVSETPAPDAGASARFRTPGGRIVATSDPALHEALSLLRRTRPRGMAWAELCDGVRSSRGALDEADLARSILACAGAGLVDLHTHLPSLAVCPPERPRASPVARWQAAEGLLVVDPRHRSLQLDRVTAEILALLDGTRDRPALHAALSARLRTGRLRLDGRADGGRTTPKADVSRVVDDVLTGLAGLGLLLGAEDAQP